MRYKFRTGLSQAVTIWAASAASATAFDTVTYAARVVATGNCHVEIGPAPVATAASPVILANALPEILSVSPGDKIAVIQDGSSTGTLYVTELSQ